jgi:hypothetical protein
VTLSPTSRGKHACYKVRVRVPHELDRVTPGLADYFLRENVTIYRGRLQRAGDALPLNEHQQNIWPVQHDPGQFKNSPVQQQFGITVAG